MAETTRQVLERLREWLEGGVMGFGGYQLRQISHGEDPRVPQALVIEAIDRELAALPEEPAAQPAPRASSALVVAAEKFLRFANCEEAQRRTNDLVDALNAERSRPADDRVTPSPDNKHLRVTCTGDYHCENICQTRKDRDATIAELREQLAAANAAAAELDAKNATLRDALASADNIENYGVVSSEDGTACVFGEITFKRSTDGKTQTWVVEVADGALSHQAKPVPDVSGHIPFGQMPLLEAEAKPEPAGDEHCGSWTLRNYLHYGPCLSWLEQAVAELCRRALREEAK